jgi:transposase
MIRKLVQKQILPHKDSFRQELTKIVLSQNLPKYSNNTGNKQFTDSQKLSVVILYIRSGKSLRDFCEELKETKWSSWLELRYEIKKSSLNNWISNFDLEFIRKLLDETNRGDEPKIIGIDGTGIETHFKSGYFQKRLNDFGRKEKSNYHKFDIIADMEGKKNILDFCFFMKQQHDAKVAKRLFRRLNFKNIYIVADKGYYSFYLYELLKLKNVVLIVPPKKYGTKTSKNQLIKDEFHNVYFENIDKYSLRNNVEGVFSALKRTILNKIRSKKCSNKKRELAFKIVLYNMRKNIFFILTFQINIKLYFFNFSK